VQYDTSSDLELENGLLRDPAGFRDQVQGAFLAARRAVDDELARLQVLEDPDATREPVTTNGHPNGRHAGNGTPVVQPEARCNPAGKPATASQVRAIVAIARRQRADLDGLLCDLGVTRPEELSLAEASTLIDQLKAAAGV
jgi:hypothetical protein